MSIDREDKEPKDQQDSLEDIKEAINFYDTKGDKKIRIDQLGPCLRSLNLCPTEKQIKQLIKPEWEKLGPECRLSCEDILPMVTELRDKARDRTEGELRAFLSNLDRDNNGTVGAADLRMMLTQCGEKLSEEEYEQVVREDHRTSAEEGRMAIDELVGRIIGGGGLI